jgi:Ca-activated chloride channel family protein
MIDMEAASAWTLESSDPGAGAPVLCGVQAEARVDNLLFELVLRQTYRNTGAKPLEVIYTFPLAWRAVLLGFATSLNGKRMEGTVVPRVEAERGYEEALAEGDAPVMLERNGSLHTANLGNLNPGDELVLEVRTAELLAFEQGRLRVTLPSTIAPRFGNVARGGLQPHAVPHASLEADYPFAVQLHVGRSLADARIECPTHAVRREASADGVRLVLSEDTRLDRDVVFIVTPREERASFSVRVNDPVSAAAPTVWMAALQPQAGPRRERVAVKLLIDCSGSMAGDSIASARRALRGVAGLLHEGDRVSLSRFGDEARHPLKLRACTPTQLRRLGILLGATKADMGGTEMGSALHEVFEMPVEGPIGWADVLMVTDGEIWDVDGLVTMAKESNQRVFIIGVGSSPAEEVLRRLAQATGGACEFATPGESMEAAARRMLERIRQEPLRELRVDWGGATAWQTAVPRGVFAGDTVTLFAGAAAGDGNLNPRLLATDAMGRVVEVACAASEWTMQGDALPRMAASRRLAGMEGKAALQLALDYQLMTEATNYLLVHVRAEEDGTREEARVHRVASMLAAGWGA